MRARFKPPSMDRLAEVDVADCEYGSEIVEIRGIVSPRSQGGWPATKDYSVHSFNLSAWRTIGGPLVPRELLILRPVAKKGNWFKAFPALAIHRMKVLLSKDKTRAVFASSVNDVEVDTELLAVAEELQKPVVYSTSRFGDLELDRSIGWFEGEAEWNGEMVRLNFKPDDNSSIEPALKTAETLWDEQAEWKRKAEDFAVQELLAVKNDNWLGDDEKPLTADQFKCRMTLHSVTFSTSGEFEFWHDDGDLFWGHSIQISGSLEKGLTDADIPG